MMPQRRRGRQPYRKLESVSMDCGLRGKNNETSNPYEKFPRTDRCGLCPAAERNRASLFRFGETDSPWSPRRRENPLACRTEGVGVHPQSAYHE